LAFKQVITESELGDLLRPKLRLFLSVDVVGSTAFKHQSQYTDSQGWLDFFVSFYTSFPDILAELTADYVKEKNLNSFEVPTFWKALGDELVFAVVLKRRVDAGHYLCVFRQALRRVVRHYTMGSQPLPINFKGAAWLAGFPVGNAAIPILDGEQKSDYDYVGPLIDVGFRLGKYASPRKLVVSVDLAALLLKEGSNLSLCFTEKQSLKGVLKDREYPIIWVDCIDDDDQNNEPAARRCRAEDDLLHSKQYQPNQLLKYCLAYIEEIGKPLRVPFIENDEQAPLVRSTAFEDEVAEVEQRLRKIFQVGPDVVTSSGTNSETLPSLEKWKPPTSKKKRLKVKVKKQ